jgi:hypothetical protein
MAVVESSQLCLFEKKHTLYIVQFLPRLLGVRRNLTEPISCLLPEVAGLARNILHLSIFGIQNIVTCTGAKIFLLFFSIQKR